MQVAVLLCGLYCIVLTDMNTTLHDMATLSSLPVTSLQIAFFSVVFRFIQKSSIYDMCLVSVLNT
jgi:hypothetical protein